MNHENGQVVKKKITKPTVVTDSVVRKLCNHLADGYTIDMACSMIGISRTSYYDHIKKNPERAELFELMKCMPTEKALANIVEAINNKNLKVSMWYLERMQPEKFNPRYYTELKVSAKYKTSV